MMSATWALLLIAAGTTTTTTTTSTVPPAHPKVSTFGHLRAVVHERDLAPKVKLAEVLARPHAYAVGALSELRGEVTIVDGVAWLAYPAAGGGARVEKVNSSDE